MVPQYVIVELFHFGSLELLRAGDFGNAQRMIGLVVERDDVLRPDAA